MQRALLVRSEHSLRFVVADGRLRRLPRGFLVLLVERVSLREVGTARFDAVADDSLDRHARHVELDVPRVTARREEVARVGVGTKARLEQRAGAVFEAAEVTMTLSPQLPHVPRLANKTK